VAGSDLRSVLGVRSDPIVRLGRSYLRASLGPIESPRSFRRSIASTNLRWRARTRLVRRRSVVFARTRLVRLGRSYLRASLGPIESPRSFHWRVTAPLAVSARSSVLGTARPKGVRARSSVGRPLVPPKQHSDSIIAVRDCCCVVSDRTARSRLVLVSYRASLVSQLIPLLACGSFVPPACAYSFLVVKFHRGLPPPYQQKGCITVVISQQ
jgi:hypothetical protein